MGTSVSFFAVNLCREGECYMIDTQKVNDATWSLSASIRDANQAFVDTLVNVQDRNMRFAQSIYEDGLNVLNSNTESTSQLIQVWQEQARRQQEAYSMLIRTSLDAYVKLVTAPFSFYKEALSTAGRELEGAKQSTGD
jgi:methionyl-tRNA synthetase